MHHNTFYFFLIQVFTRRVVKFQMPILQSIRIKSPFQVSYRVAAHWSKEYSPKHIFLRREKILLGNIKSLSQDTHWRDKSTENIAVNIDTRTK